MDSAVLLEVFRGLLAFIVGLYFLAFRPLSRRIAALAVTAVLMGLYGFLSLVSPPPEEALRWLSLASTVAFLAFAFLFPTRLRWASVAGLAWQAAAVLCAAQAAYLVMDSTPPMGALRLYDRMMLPGALGSAMSMVFLLLGRLQDLRRPGVPDAQRHAGPSLFMLLAAGIFTGGGFEAGHVLGGLVGRTDFPLFLQEGAGRGYLVSASLVWWVLPGAGAAYAALRLRSWLPACLLAAGFVSYLPVLVEPDLPRDIFEKLRIWGFLLAPALAMYAQARWAPFKGEPTRISTGWAMAAFAGLLGYAFVFVATLSVVPDAAAAILAPIVGLVAGVVLAAMVLPRARKLHLQRLFALAAQDRLAPGALVLGRYRITRLLGEGSQGRVYEAVDRRQKARVVLKALTEEDAIREARVLKGLDHPNIIRFVDVVEVPGFTLLVLEFADGGTVRGLLARTRGRLPARESTALLDGILSGLAEAHAHGLAHRDVKPENILLVGGVPKLADFGVARRVDPGATLRPDQGAGTLAYLAPEQVRGEPGDARSDVYAAGVVLHEVLTGKAPIDLPADDFLARQAILAKPPTLRLGAEDRRLVPVLRKALAKDPAQRFRDAGELRAGLRAARPG